MKEVSFEENMESLEKVVQELENDELNLEESIKRLLECIKKPLLGKIPKGDFL